MLEGVSGGNQGPALIRCFDDDHGQRDPTDKPVSERKVLREGRSARPQLADQSSIHTNTYSQLSVFRRIDAIKPAPQHAECGSAGREASSVRGAVSSPSQAGHDNQPTNGELGSQPPRHFQRIRCRRPRADDCDTRLGEGLQAATDPEHRRRIANRAQQRRIVLIIPAHYHNVGRVRGGEPFGGVAPRGRGRRLDASVRGAGGNDVFECDAARACGLTKTAKTDSMRTATKTRRIMGPPSRAEGAPGQSGCDTSRETSVKLTVP